MRWATLLLFALAVSACSPPTVFEETARSPCGLDADANAAVCPLQVPALGDPCSEEVTCQYCAQQAGPVSDVEADAGGATDAGPEADAGEAVIALRCDGSLWLPAD